VKDCLRDFKVTDIKNLKKWRKEELALQSVFREKKQLIHKALCGKKISLKKIALAMYIYLV
jgi:hypothetical protein